MNPTPQAAGTVPAHPARGALLIALGVFVFACMDCTTKYLVSQYEVPMVVAIRYIVNYLLMVLLLAPTQGRKLVTTRRTGLVLARGLCLAATSLVLGIAIQRMPLAELTSILFLSPIMVLLMSGPLLGERPGVAGWTAAFFGFVGVLLIARPGAGLDPLATVLALCGVVLTAAYQLLSRLLARTDQPMPMLFYTALVGSLLFGAYLPWSWGGPVPTALQLFLFLCVGAMGGLGHYLFTVAHRHAPTSVLAPIMYLQLVWAGLLGWGFFGHVPPGLAILGMGIVAVSGIAVGLRARGIRQEAMAEPVE